MSSHDAINSSDSEDYAESLSRNNESPEPLQFLSTEDPTVESELNLQEPLDIITAPVLPNESITSQSKHPLFTITPTEEFSAKRQRLNASQWSWIPNTLHAWREKEGFPTITEVGESSIARQEYPCTREPPHHSIPLIVARMLRQETRVEAILDTLGEKTEIDKTIEFIHYRIENSHDEVTALRLGLAASERRIEKLEETIVTMEERLKHFEASANVMTTSASRNVDLEQRMDRLEHTMNHFNTMVANLKGFEAYMSAWDIIPKKD